MRDLIIGSYPCVSCSRKRHERTSWLLQWRLSGCGEDHRCAVSTRPFAIVIVVVVAAVVSIAINIVLTFFAELFTLGHVENVLDTRCESVVERCRSNDCLESRLISVESDVMMLLIARGIKYERNDSR